MDAPGSLKAVPAELRKALTRASLRGEVSFRDVDRGIHATDASHYQIMPLGVVWPRDEADVLTVLRIAREHGVAITPRGAATSLSGQTHGPGLVVDCSRYMDKVLEVDEERREARALLD